MLKGLQANELANMSGLAVLCVCVFALRSPKEFFTTSSLASVTESTVKAIQPEKDYEYILHTLLRYQKFTYVSNQHLVFASQTQRLQGKALVDESFKGRFNCL